MRKVLAACPVCGGSLAITGLTCGTCQTGITGRFETCDFCRLTDEQSTFLRLFVQRRGNLSEMEKALGISYPTVRNKLEEIIRVMQTPAPPDPAPTLNRRDAVLQQVAERMITAERALELLAELSEENQ
jgi:hypothetical protein